MPARKSISESWLGENASSRRVDGVEARIQPRRDDLIDARRRTARDEDHGVVEEPLRERARQGVLRVVGDDRVRAAGALLAIHGVKACLRVK